MPSWTAPRKAVRTAIQTWLDSLTWSTTPDLDVGVQAGLATLPDVAIQLSEESVDFDIRECLSKSADGGVAIYRIGEVSAVGQLQIRAKTQDAAEVLEVELEGQFDAAAQSDARYYLSRSMTVTIFGQSCELALVLTGERHVLPPAREAVEEGVWRITMPCSVIYPKLPRRTEALGAMNITTDHTASSAYDGMSGDPVDMDNFQTGA